MWVRREVVAGRFYPGDGEELRARVREALAGARVPEGLHPKALIVPHAGYAYSAPVAASGYAALGPDADAIQRVVLLGTCHTSEVEGVAATSAGAFRTPLGMVELDEEGIRAAIELPGVRFDDEAHARDHALEVQLPFLQVVLGAFRILPFLVGAAAERAVAALLDLLWDGSSTLIVVSSDLSHYHPHDEAARRDRAAADAIERLDPDAMGPRSACGREAIAGLLRSARRHHLEARTLDLRNSGDTAGPRERVVGYGAFAFSPVASASPLGA